MNRPIETDAVTASGFEMRTRDVGAGGGANSRSVRISYLVSNALEDAGFINAFSTRTGGVSAFSQDSLSLGYSAVDATENVRENRRRFLEGIGAIGVEILTMKQTHSTDRVAVDGFEGVEGSQTKDKRGPKCDALLARGKGYLLGVQTADCLPVLIADPKTGAMAAVHAGWRGTAGRITERTVADLMQRFGVNPRTCLAALGPSVCGECYEVGPEVVERFKREFGYWHKLISSGEPGTNSQKQGSGGRTSASKRPAGAAPAEGKAWLDIRAANRQQLLFCGFDEDRIFSAPLCTMHNNEMFFSYRLEAGGGGAEVGRLLSVIGHLYAGLAAK